MTLSKALHCRKPCQSISQRTGFQCDIYPFAVIIIIMHEQQLFIVFVEYADAPADKIPMRRSYPLIAGNFTLQREFRIVQAGDLYKKLFPAVPLDFQIGAVDKVAYKIGVIDQEGVPLR